MQLLRKLLAEVRAAEWYSIIADETKDLSGAEKFAISLRWVDPEYNIFEDLIRMVDVESTTAEQLIFFHWPNAVHRHMTELQIWLNQLRALPSVSKTSNP